MKYKVNLKKTEEGYAVWCPGLPDCWSQGQTEEEALDNIKEAITDYLAVREELIQDVELRYVEPKAKALDSNIPTINSH